ncbi:uncharacterized protein C2845_PM14G19550 [Panicum miliaceum]|uniref:Stress up-regulated Nod 19 protein n=1 Tax=Panicum miliaceum TaxID=4540 RepID=A0A3L6PSD8_PANMI|nr:uncharacterized protein C2845_PM14G19550 [Panicum miliaceum]
MDPDDEVMVDLRWCARQRRQRRGAGGPDIRCGARGLHTLRHRFLFSSSSSPRFISCSVVEDLSLLFVAGGADELKMPPLFLVLLIAFASATTTAPLPTARALVDDARGYVYNGHLLKSKTFLSPPFSLRPGSVSNKWYMDVAFPRGHLALKSFNGEGGQTLPRANSGVCKGSLGQYFGLGSETRRTLTWVPDPYGIEIGGGDAPEGYEERWSLNVHAIDTRGAADKPGCTECRCDLYNVTVDERGRRIAEGYAGGLHCCYDQTRCRVEDGFAAAGEPRELFLRYTVMWVDWSDAAVVPVRIYILDVTDTALLDGKPEPDCKVEYTVEACSSENRAKNDCVDMKVTKEALPRGGDIVFAVGHHTQDGRLLCSSTPIYGDGEEAGNEAGYIVGMSTCYPEPGTVRIRDGEALTVVSNYTGERRRTGVMGHFYLLVADDDEQQQAAPNKQPPSLCFSFPASWCVPAWMFGNLR